jgi:replicative DNA helicase
MDLTSTILAELTSNEEFARKVLPFIKEDYFQSITDRIIFKKIQTYFEEYKTVPSKDTLYIEIENDDSIGESDWTATVTALNTLPAETDSPNLDWLVDKTEAFCQEKAVYNAIMESIHIIDGKSKSKTKQAIPEILSDALGVSFDNHIGHDFLDDYESRYDFYHKKEERIPFDLDYFNRITKGGLPRKSLNIILAGTGVGKSLFMCHAAAANMMQGNNVLYITMEMAEEKIAERIDANLLNVQVDELINLPKDLYDKKITKLRDQTPGKLIIKEYPTASAHTGHFRHLVNELSVKRNFTPDIIYVDYLNICASSRIKGLGGSVNTYSFVKAIAEELRGLAVEKNVPIISATQTTRSGFTNSDIGLEDTSESFGLPATADLMFALISTEELQDLNQMMVKQLKNRYSDPTMNKRFVIGVDRAKMRLYDVEDSAQDIMDGPVLDQNNHNRFSEEQQDEQWTTRKFGKKDYSELFN